MESVSATLPYRVEATFDSQNSIQRTTYFSLRNDATGASFGLFFVDDHLRHVLPSHEAMIFFLCRDLSTPTGSHWIEQDQAPGDSWLRDRSILGANSRADQQIPELRKDAGAHSKNSTVVDSIVMAERVVVISPVLLLGAPVLVYDAARDKSEDRAKERERQQLADERAKRLEKQRTGFFLVKLGITRSQAIQYMGEPDKTKAMADEAEYLWFDSFSGVLVREGKVTLRERLVYRPFWETNERDKSFYTKWAKLHHLDLAKECPKIQKGG